MHSPIARPLNDFYAIDPAGFGAICNKDVGYDQSIAGHGMMFSDFSSSVRKVGYSVSYQSIGASASEWQRLKNMLLDFIESKL